MTRPVICKKTSSRLGGLTWIDRMRPLKSTDHARHELRAVRHLEVQLLVDLLDRDPVLRRDVLLQGPVAGDDELVAADEALERRGRVQGLDRAVVDDGDAVAVLGLVHVVGRHEDGDADLLAQARTCSQMALRVCGSNPTVGSSRKSTLGWCIRPRAISSRRFMPPEKVRTSA